MFPDPANLTTAQHLTSVLVIASLFVVVLGLSLLGALILHDYFRARRDPDVEADYQARRAAANKNP